MQFRIITQIFFVCVERKFHRKHGWNIFTFSVDNHKTFGIHESLKFNCADAVGRDSGFPGVLRILGGLRAKLMDLFLIFKNRDRSYVARHVRKAFMDSITGHKQEHGCKLWCSEYVFVNFDIFQRWE